MSFNPLRHEDYPTAEAAFDRLTLHHKLSGQAVYDALQAARSKPQQWIPIEGTRKKFSVRISNSKFHLRIRLPSTPDAKRRNPNREGNR